MKKNIKCKINKNHHEFKEFQEKELIYVRTALAYAFNHFYVTFDSKTNTVILDVSDHLVNKEEQTLELYKWLSNYLKIPIEEVKLLYLVNFEEDDFLKLVK